MKKYLFLGMILAAPLSAKEGDEFDYLYKLDEENSEACEESYDQSEEECPCPRPRYRICIPPGKPEDGAELKEEELRDATAWPGEMRDPFYDQFVH